MRCLKKKKKKKKNPQPSPPFGLEKNFFPLLNHKPNDPVIKIFGCFLKGDALNEDVENALVEKDDSLSAFAQPDDFLFANGANAKPIFLVNF